VPVLLPPPGLYGARACALLLLRWGGLEADDADDPAAPRAGGGRRNPCLFGGPLLPLGLGAPAAAAAAPTPTGGGRPDASAAPSEDGNGTPPPPTVATPLGAVTGVVGGVLMLLAVVARGGDCRGSPRGYGDEEPPGC